MNQNSYLRKAAAKRRTELAWNLVATIPAYCCASSVDLYSGFLNVLLEYDVRKRMRAVSRG
jgi:hypothetical protein